jgi:hypothetical protein
VNVVWRRMDYGYLDGEGVRVVVGECGGGWGGVNGLGADRAG